MTLFSDPPAVRKLSLVRLSAELARSLSGIGKVAVEGEVYKPSVRPGGRIYFTLKDRAAQITVTCPASRSRRCRVVAGERVQVTGQLDWVNSWGALQFAAEEVIPVGEGAVAAAIAEARARLAAEGLLGRPRRPLPRLPNLIGVICGSDAAVRADIESVVAARFPGYPMLFREVTVSGSGAADGIGRALDDLTSTPGVDVVILARGGGDAAQLLPFSDEDLCRAMCRAAVPVVSAIGHEGDRPLCDEVADHRFGTPSLAAAAVVPDRKTLESELAALVSRGHAILEQRWLHSQRRLAQVDRDRAVRAGVERAYDRLARAGGRLELVHPARRLAAASEKLAGARSHMEALSPLRVLERGYSVVRAADGAVVRAARSVRARDRVTITVAQGSLGAVIEEVDE